MHSIHPLPNGLAVIHPLPNGLTVIAGRPGLGKTLALLAIARGAPEGCVFAPGDEEQKTIKARLAIVGADVEVLSDAWGPADFDAAPMALVDDISRREMSAEDVRAAVEHYATLRRPTVVTLSAGTLRPWLRDFAKEAWLLESVFSMVCHWSNVRTRRGCAISVEPIAKLLYQQPSG